MRPTLKAALLAALPIEIVNFWVVGYPAGANSLTSANQTAGIALQWYVLHLPGVIASDRIPFLREHALTCSIMLWITGFLDTAILLAALISVTRLALHTLHKVSSPMKHAH